jgi:hypothetical protein
VQAGDLGQALQGDVAEIRDFEEAASQGLDEARTARGRLENVAQRDPVEEAQQGFEGGFDERGFGGRPQHFGTQLVNGCELVAHALLELAALGRGHLLLRVVEHLLREQAQDDHVVLAYAQAAVTRRDDLVDEGGPVVRPFLLEDRDEDEVELVQQSAVGAAAVVVVGELDDEVDDEVADAWRD